MLDEVARVYKGKIAVGKIDIEEEPALAKRYKIKGVPTLLFMKKDKLLQRWVGSLSEEATRNFFEQLLCTSTDVVLEAQAGADQS